MAADNLYDYYGPALTPKQDVLFSGQPQRTPHTTFGSLASTAGYGLGIGALVGSGFIRHKGVPLWNRYVRGIRAVEEYSPGNILRTFQLSSFFSQFADPTKVFPFGLPTKISGGQLAGNTQYLNYLTKLIGTSGGVNTYQKLVQEGVELRGGQLFFGEGQIALKHAAGIFGPTSAFTRAGESYYLSLGLDPSKVGAFRTELKGMGVQVIGGATRRQHVGRQAGMMATEYISRFNRLLEKPFEIEPLKGAFGFLKEKHGFQLGVKYGKAHQMFGRMVWKFGVLAPFAYLGYQSLNYLARETVGAGPSDIIAGGIKGTSLLTSRLAEITGLHAYREKQEEMAPGSTTLKKLLAFPAMLTLAGITTAFGIKTAKMMKLRREGMPLGAANIEAKRFLGSFTGEGYFARAGRFITRKEGLFSRENVWGRLLRKIATAQETGELYFKGIGRVGPGKLLAGLGAAIGLTSVLPFLPGALIPSTRPGELEDIYAGKKEVAIRKGRWWIFGRSPHEGTRIDYYRPHWYPRMQQAGREVSIWGQEPVSPVEKFLKKEFTYELEREHYLERPYPITGLPFQDVPFIGPVLSATLGRLVKPEAYMHEDQWREGEGYPDLGPGFGQRVATELGEVPMGAPISPHGAKGVIGEQIYRLTEMIGLPGFVFESLKERVTGTGSFFEEERQLESAARIASFERQYWDLSLGDIWGATEAFRRLYPHRRRQIELFNPIPNLMPRWLPGPGDKSPDFLHGDPFTKVPEGEIRLPGPGYATRFPELEGVAPEDYPLIHQFKILADIAPYSDKYKLAYRAARSARAREGWTGYDEQIYQTTLEQVKRKKEGKQFSEYKSLTPTGEIFGDVTYYGGAESSSVIAAINRMKASATEKPGIFTRLFGGYWELLSHNADTAFDQLIPISPAAKLVHMRTAIEDYEVTQAYGTMNSFWNHPIRDFIRPFMTMIARGLGATGIPGHVQHRREVEQYFDILKYVKYARLGTIASEAGDYKAVKEFERIKNETLFGINPYTMNYSNIYRAMPRRERDYFESFQSAKTEEERAQILELVPDNMKGIYQARWRMMLANDIRTAQKEGILTDEQQEEANKILASIREESRREGMPKTEELWAEYLKTRSEGESYGDWYRRTKLLPGLSNLPGPDFVGWHPSVDLEDIKLKLVENMGEDMHDYNLWPSRQARMANKPYINNEAIEELTSGEELSADDMKERLSDLLLAGGIRNANIFTRHSYSYINRPSVTIDYEQVATKEDLARGLLE